MHYQLDRAIQQAALESIDYCATVYIFQGNDAGQIYFFTSTNVEAQHKSDRVVYEVTVNAIG